MKKIEEEIKALKNEERAVNLTLIKGNNSLYRTISSLSLEGEYILNSKEIKDQIVLIEKKENELIFHGINSDEVEINVFLTKSRGSILSALKENIKRDSFQTKPFFIVGPPGTGKSTVITRTIEKALKNNKRILVASPTNMAVENVFERIDLKSIGLKNGELLLTIKTENESFSAFSPNFILESQKKSIQDEIDLLKEIKDTILDKRRLLEPDVYLGEKKIERKKVLLDNANKKAEVIKQEIKKLSHNLIEINSRIEALEANSFIRSLSNILLSKKVGQYKAEKKLLSQKIEALENQLLKINEEKEKIKISSHLKDMKELKEELKKIKEELKKIDNEIARLSKKESSINLSSLFKEAKLIGTTLASASISKAIQKEKFDMVIIDEASMALYPMLIIVSQLININKDTNNTIEYKESSCFTKAQNEAIRHSLNSQLILIGDPRQLSPIASTEEMKETVFDKFGIGKIFEGHNLENTVFLDINFRNHPLIVQFISKMFYGGMLKSGKDRKNSQSLYLRRSFSKMVSKNGSYINMGSCYLVVEQVERALKRGRRSIGVISPFRKQVELINKNLVSLKEEYPDADIQVGTVHKFQGKEKKIIIFDITFSPTNNNELPAIFRGNIKSEVAKLLNVATTRAEDFFVLVGDIDSISQMPNKNSIFVDWVNKIKSLSN